MASSESTASETKDNYLDIIYEEYLEKLKSIILNNSNGATKNQSELIFKWLEKFGNVENSSKLSRNYLVIKLFKQLDNNQIDLPFINETNLTKSIQNIMPNHKSMMDTSSRRPGSKRSEINYNNYCECNSPAAVSKFEWDDSQIEVECRNNIDGLNEYIMALEKSDEELQQKLAEKDCVIDNQMEKINEQNMEIENCMHKIEVLTEQTKRMEKKLNEYRKLNSQHKVSVSEVNDRSKHLQDALRKIDTIVVNSCRLALREIRNIESIDDFKNRFSFDAVKVFSKIGNCLDMSADRQQEIKNFEKEFPNHLKRIFTKIHHPNNNNSGGGWAQYNPKICSTQIQTTLKNSVSRYRSNEVDKIISSFISQYDEVVNHEITILKILEKFKLNNEFSANLEIYFSEMQLKTKDIS